MTKSSVSVGRHRWFTFAHLRPQPALERVDSSHRVRLGLVLVNRISHVIGWGVLRIIITAGCTSSRVTERDIDTHA